MQNELSEICKNFQIKGKFLAAQPCGSGHINDTFASTFERDNKRERYIHQRINDKIFKEPEKVIENISRITRHISKKLSDSASEDVLRRCLTLVPSIDGAYYWIDKDGSYWRTYYFIEDASAFEIVETESQAFNAAFAFGEFQKQLADLKEPRLHETIPDFHNTPKYLDKFKEALNTDRYNRAKFAKEEIRFILDNEESCYIFTDLLRDGKIQERITHNDTKLNNVLFDNNTNEAICIIDLDTVMPGLVCYDFGDLVRTAINAAAEDEKDLSKVKMRMNMFQALACGYLKSAGEFLTQKEKETLPLAGKIITLENGIRFLTDYLSGDSYFKIHREDHNLDRCRAQFALARSIDNQLSEMNRLLRETED